MTLEGSPVNKIESGLSLLPFTSPSGSGRKSNWLVLQPQQQQPLETLLESLQLPLHRPTELRLSALQQGVVFSLHPSCH